MCGICGILGLEDANLLKSMMDTMPHRGPDESGTYKDTGIMLGHQRLSIIDLKSGKQAIHNEDETIWIIYNGEIYNFIQLKKTLEKLGYSIKSKVLNSRIHGNIPQNRERIFIVGFLLYLLRILHILACVYWR